MYSRKIGKSGIGASQLLSFAMLVIFIIVGWFMVQNMIEIQNEALAVKKQMFDGDFDGDGIKFNDLCPCGFDNSKHPVKLPGANDVVGLCKSAHVQSECPVQYKWIVQETGKEGCYYTVAQCQEFVALNTKDTKTT